MSDVTRLLSTVEQGGPRAAEQFLPLVYGDLRRETLEEKAIPMTERVTPRRRGSYGIDAPYAPAFLTAMVVLYLAMAIITGRVLIWLAALFILAIDVSYLYATLRGKFVVWADLLDRLGLRGDERILDLGCGRGAVLLMAAQHLTTGRAVGVDLWRSVDQSGNSAEATRRNAVAEGVADRVELHTADMTALPFEDDSFDMVLSSLAIHNIRGRAGREKAISEAVRVLCPGGRLLIADIRGTRQHQAQLVKIGMNDVARRGLGWRFWWCDPFGVTRLVTATKPEPRTAKGA
jgi:ubiquinone/menaquinone biosynthesis C-methylase UbiE